MKSLTVLVLKVTENVSIPAGSELVLRCADIGKYRLEGNFIMYFQF